MTPSDMETMLASPMRGAEVKQLAHNTEAPLLYNHIFDSQPASPAHDRVARNAAWILTHKPTSELLQLPQDKLTTLALTTHDTSLRRLVLALIERQGVKKEDMRTDLLDFCLQHMTMPDEPPGVQALCLKLANQMCGYYPELKHEFAETLNLIEADHYKSGMRHLIIKTRKQLSEK